MSRSARPRRTRAPRPASRAASRPIPDLLSAGRSLLRPQLIGTLLVVLAAAALPMLLPLAGVLRDARDALVRLLGLYTFALVLAVAGLGALLALRRQQWLRRHARHLLGVAALLIFSAGVLGRWHPATDVGAVDLAEHSAGGDAGRALLDGPWTALAWLLSLPLGYALLWPRTARALLRRAPVAAAGAAVALWELGLHRRLGRALPALLALLRRPRDAEVREPLDAAIADWGAPQVADLAGPPSPSLARRGSAAGRAEDVEDAGNVGGAFARPGENEPEPAAATLAPPRITQITMDMETPSAEVRHSADGWQLPPVALLAEHRQASKDRLDSERRARVIEQTLQSFGVDAKVTEWNEGPAVTQFGVEPGWDVRTRQLIERDASGQALLGPDGQPRTKELEISRTRVRVNRITQLQNDLALALAAPALRIEAPVPGRQMVGIEVPNLDRTAVALRGVLESPAFARLAQRSPLPIALGTSVTGEAVVADLASMPHLLIAGATGSGKSVCLNAIICCLLMNHSPQQLRLVLIDPKRVELTPFAQVPHLAFSEIVVDMDRVVGALQAVTNEMDSRYRRFAKAGARDVKRYNEQVPAAQRLPYWVVVIDELADLMAVAPFQVERQIVRLAQLARATGIHLVVATQRPSVDVVTGLIKANFPTRIAFAVASQVDSRTVLDHAGAEKLLGRGDMLYQPTDAQQPRRVQGVYVSDAETEAVVKFWTQDRFQNLVPEKHDELLRQAEQQLEDETVDEDADRDDDPMLRRALDLAGESNRISTSMLQRKLRLGYPRAARIMDTLEERGIVGPAEPGGNSRQVLIGARIPGSGFSPPGGTGDRDTPGGR